ncbi:MAG: hypothetical protein Ct9H300mP19_20090 [Dehalococcoidia bacterium]|nr:MAG: hypothetical protein Ct9H300mP19_20090 [Dehalococcoidia bacterium]
MERGRITPKRREKNDRIADWQEVYLKWDDSDARNKLADAWIGRAILQQWMPSWKLNS